jgi:hypothetical protein
MVFKIFTLFIKPASLSFSLFLPPKRFLISVRSRLYKTACSLPPHHPTCRKVQNPEPAPIYTNTPRVPCICIFSLPAPHLFFLFFLQGGARRLRPLPNTPVTNPRRRPRRGGGAAWRTPAEACRIASGSRCRTWSATAWSAGSTTRSSRRAPATPP